MASVGKRLLQATLLVATKKDTVKAVEGFSLVFSGKYPKAVDCLVNDQDELLTFLDYPAEHWVHLQTTSRTH